MILTPAYLTAVCDQRLIDQKQHLFSDQQLTYHPAKHDNWRGADGSLGVVVVIPVFVQLRIHIDINLKVCALLQ